ncbi:hypothetical protein C2I18_21605 [Paenibacillus sp. PK3_47]|uniref:hypothetical protein n=1 Tax=Paenibacillus sp. PK3_47 TaxID=2072642 RepID=UPI00201D4EB3|nr:hypothetical protein [Paenibacillus sp. PK3_47]UQZ35902.1 hypothetical protein C2I18_21605 [Paenibacillus sp. PK3_47]
MKRDKELYPKGVILRFGTVALNHLFIIYILDIKMGEAAGILEWLIAYFCPVILICTTCSMALKMKKIRCDVLWMICSLLPVTGVLYNLKQLSEHKGTEPGIVDLSHLDLELIDGQIVWLFFFPLAFSMIQIMLMFGLWILRVTREE